MKVVNIERMVNNRTFQVEGYFNVLDNEFVLYFVEEIHKDLTSSVIDFNTLDKELREFLLGEIAGQTQLEDEKHFEGKYEYR